MKSKNWLLIFAFLLLFPFVCFAKSERYLFLRVRLEFVSHTLIKGELVVKLPPRKVYTFFTKGLFVEKVKVNRLTYKASEEEQPYIRVFSGRYGGTLKLYFRKRVKYQILPLTPVGSPFPYPDEPFKFKLVFLVPKNYKVYPRVPSDGYSFVRKKWWKVYTFKELSFPISKPLLVLSCDPLKETVINMLNLRFRFYSIKSVYGKVKSLSQAFKSMLNQVGLEEYPFETVWIFINKDFNSTLRYSHAILISQKVLNSPVSFLHLFVKKAIKDAFFIKNSTVLEGITTYFVDYFFSQNKERFKKSMLAFSPKKAKAFFYMVELSSVLGKRVLKNAFFSFYKTNFLKQTNLLSFFSYLKTAYPSKLLAFADYSAFTKVKLYGEVTYINRLNNEFVVHLLISKKPVFTTGVPEGRMVIVPIKVFCGNVAYLYQIPVYSSFKTFQFTCSEVPSKILIDPTYSVWRILSPEEVPVTIEGLFKKPGFLVYSDSKLPFYKDLIDLFYSVGYVRVSSAKENNSFENIVYFNTSPLFWQFTPPDSGFYIKVIPNPYQIGGYIGYIYTSSINQLDLALPLLTKYEYASELYIKDGRVVYFKRDPSSQGITVPLRPVSVGISLKRVLTPKILARKLLTTQLILIGEDNSQKESFVNFYSQFLNALYSLNSKLIILVDASREINPDIKEFLQGKTSLEQVLGSLNPSDINISLRSFAFLLNWAKAHGVRVVAGGLETRIIHDIFTRGLEGLSQEELLKLPEVDFYDPAYRYFLKKCFSNSTEGYVSNFEKFFEVQELKKEALAESILKVLQENKTYQVVVISTKNKIAYPWVISESLRKRGLIGFRTIILSSKVDLNPELGDYLFSGEVSPAELITY